MAATLDKETKQRISSQKDTILKMLKAAGSKGVKNSELLKVALRFSGVLFLLRKDGHIIEIVDNGGGLYSYVLVGYQEPEEKVSAYEKLFDLVADHDKVTATQLMSIMQQNNICFKRKAVR